MSKPLTNQLPAEYQALTTILQARRSIRKFRPDPIDDETVRLLADAARFTPSAGNAQPWDLIMVRDPETKRKFGDIYIEQLRQKNRLEMTRAADIRFFGDEPPEPTAGFVDAGLLVVVIGDPRVIDAFPLRTKIDKGPQHIISSLANIVVTLHYAAASLGLASQYLSDTGSPEMEIMLADLLGFPDHLRAYETVCIGHADMKPSSRYVKEVEDIVHLEKYNMDLAKTDAEIRRHIIEKLRPNFKKVL
ncbi:MAG: nitroreductase family protein [Rhodospirillales bacterium]|nr:nitroreductase family protein [Rhodospirillales bacterium]